jgi:hypothetical protein
MTKMISEEETRIPGSCYKHHFSSVLRKWSALGFSKLDQNPHIFQRYPSVVFKILYQKILRDNVSFLLFGG